MTNKPRDSGKTYNIFQQPKDWGDESKHYGWPGTIHPRENGVHFFIFQAATIDQERGIVKVQSNNNRYLPQDQGHLNKFKIKCWGISGSAPAPIKSVRPGDPSNKTTLTIQGEQYPTEEDRET